MQEGSIGNSVKNNTLSLGTICNTPSQVALASKIGMDWFLIDQMWPGFGWEGVEELVRAGEEKGIEPMVRPHSEPWFERFDPRVAVHVSRYFGLGIDYAFLSHSGVEEVEDCLALAEEFWHRNAVTDMPFSSLDEWQEGIEKIQDSLQVVPHGESTQTLEKDTIRDIITLEEIDFHFFGMTDGTKELTDSNTPDFYNEEMWDILDYAVDLGNKNNTIIGANTSYAYSENEIINRISKLHKNGINLILIQSMPFINQVTSGKLLNDIRSTI